MTALQLASPRSTVPVLSSLFERQPALAAYGLLLVALSAMTFALQSFDTRVLSGDVNVWVKPTKFFFSIGVFALTSAWFFGYVRPERRNAPAMRYVVWALIAAGSFELAYISLQAFRGLESHFNESTTFHMVMYALMGVGAVVLISTTLPLAWEIGRRPVAGLRPDYVAAVVIGLVLTFVFGGGLAAYMSSTGGHSVGTDGGHFPLFGWNRTGGDMRVAHFFGMHLEQALPLLAAIAVPLSPRSRWAILAAGVVAGAGITLAVFFQAIGAQPFLAMVTTG
jgi:hypothetical protein